MKKSTSLILLSFLINGFLNAQAPKQVNIPIQAIKDSMMLWLGQARQEHYTPALAMIVTSTGSTIFEGVSGVKKAGSTEPVALNSRFHLGSNTKAMTAFLAARLVEDGLLQWDTKVLEVFPEWKDSVRAEYEDITLRDLLSHRAGIQPFTSGFEFVKLPVFKGGITGQRRQFSYYLLQQKPVKIDKNSGYNYSNAGYSIAAAVMEKVSGKSYDDMMQEMVFTPLGINASFGWPQPNEPWGHQLLKDNVFLPQSPDGPYKLSPLVAPAGDCNMSISDYGKFLRVNLVGLAGQDTLLKSETYQFLHYANLPKSYSMGWGFGNKDGLTFSSPDGSGGTFYLHTIILKEPGFAIAIAANSADEGTIKSIYALRKKVQATLLK